MSRVKPTRDLGRRRPAGGARWSGVSVGCGRLL